MDNTKKLKVVFDFIADYLSEDEKLVIEPSTEESEEELTINSDESKDSLYKRAYVIMRKIDERDRTEAITTRAVQMVKRPLEKELQEVRDKYNAVQNGNLNEDKNAPSNPKPKFEVIGTGGDSVHVAVGKDLKSVIEEESKENSNQNN